MAARKTTKITASDKKSSSKRVIVSRKVTSTSLLDYFKFGESYTSLVLGIIVVIVASILLVSLFKTRTEAPQITDSQKGATSISTIAQELNKITPTANQIEAVEPSLSPTATNTPVVSPSPVKDSTNQSGQRMYTVKPGDDLWAIAQSQYKDGYQWVAIAKANSLTNPSVINVGNKLILPSVTPTPAQITASQDQQQSAISGQRISGNTYIIMHGDDLWNIAVRAYGNGYKWVDIAKANNLSSPNLIHSGNSIKIPR